MEEHKIGQNIEANKAFMERIFWHMVGVVNLVRRRGEISPGRNVSWQEIGTGAACRYRNANIILTAKHVLDDAGPSDLRFLPRGTGRIEWADEPKRTRVERAALDVHEIIRCTWDDLAAIVLGPKMAESVNIRFCELPGNFSNPPEVEPVLIIGYPYDQSFVAETMREGTEMVHRKAAKSDGFWGEVATTEKPLSGFDRERHFLVKFHPSFPGGRPEGYSGAGVWFPRKADAASGVWTADPLLVGIETHAYEKLGLLRVIRSSAVRTFLEEVLG